MFKIVKNVQYFLGIVYHKNYENVDFKNNEYKCNEREMFYLTTHSTHFIYGYMASDIWLRTILIVRKETRCRHIGYSFWLAARVLLYAPSHRQDNTYHSLWYTSRGALAGTRNSSKCNEVFVYMIIILWTYHFYYLTVPKFEAQQTKPLVL